MKKAFKIAGIVLGVYLLCSIAYFLLEPKSVKEARKLHAELNLERVTKRIAALRAALPDPEGDIAAQQFPNDAIDWANLATLGVDEIDYFSDTTLFVDRPMP